MKYYKYFDISLLFGNFDFFVFFVILKMIWASPCEKVQKVLLVNFTGHVIKVCYSIFEKRFYPKKNYINVNIHKIVNSIPNLSTKTEKDVEISEFLVFEQV